METIRLYDLLRKRYYNVKVPNKIKYKGKIYLWCDDEHPFDYINEHGESLTENLEIFDNPKEKLEILD